MLKQLGRTAIIWVALLVLCYAALAVVYLLPDEPYDSKLPASVAVFKQKTDNYQDVQTPLIGNIEFASIDYYGDAMMLETSMHDPDYSLLVNVMSPSRYVRLDRPGMEGRDNPPQDLDERINGLVKPNYGHGRYWNGYRVPVRILGMFFSYNGMRVVNGIALSLLALGTGFALFRRFGWKFATWFGATLLATSFYVVVFCLQYSAPYYVMFAGILAVLYLSKRYALQQWVIPTFFVIGCLTSYFDLLTAPVITLGGPLIVLLFGYLRNARSDRRSSLVLFFQASIMWALGYAGFWVSQIVIAQLATGEAVITNAAQQVGYYSISATGSEGIIGTYKWAFSATIAVLCGQAQRYINTPISGLRLLAGLSAIAGYVVALVVMIKRRAVEKGIALHHGALLLTAGLPIARALVMPDHVIKHTFMTHREMAVFIFALGAYYLLVTRKGESRK